MNDEIEKLLKEKGKDYGDPEEFFEKLKHFWAIILDTPLTEQDVALCMLSLKLLRLVHQPEHEDSAVDLEGYARIFKKLQKKSFH